MLCNTVLQCGARLLIHTLNYYYTVVGQRSAGNGPNDLSYGYDNYYYLY